MINSRKRELTVATSLPDAFVGLNSVHAGLGATGPATSAHANGRYTLGDLGPSSWTLFFSTFGGYASVFSGVRATASWPRGQR